MVSPRRSLAVAALCALAVCALVLAIVGCASPAHAQERQALVVPEKDAAELAKAHAALVKAQKTFDEAKARVEKRLVPKDWPCCLYVWSSDFRVMWPESVGSIDGGYWNGRYWGTLNNAPLILPHSGAPLSPAVMPIMQGEPR